MYSYPPKENQQVSLLFSSSTPSSASLGLSHSRSCRSPPQGHGYWEIKNGRAEPGTEGRLAGSLFMDVWAHSLRKVISRLVALTPIPALSLWLIRLFKGTNREPGEDVNYLTIMQRECSHGPVALVSTCTHTKVDIDINMYQFDI